MRGAGLSVEALTRYIRLAQEGEDTAEERRDILIGQREMLKGKIAVLQEALDKLNYKIDVFYGKMRECEKNLQERA